MRPHKLRPKIHNNKENKEPRSTFEYRDEKSYQYSRLGQTEAFDEDRERFFKQDGLVCHENVHNSEKIVNKIKKKIKYLSHEIPFSSSFEMMSSICKNEVI